MILPGLGKFTAESFSFGKQLWKLPAHPNTPSLELLPDGGGMIFSGLGKFIGEAFLLQLQPHLWQAKKLDASL